MFLKDYSKPFACRSALSISVWPPFCRQSLEPLRWRRPAPSGSPNRYPVWDHFQQMLFLLIIVFRAEILNRFPWNITCAEVVTLEFYRLQTQYADTYFYFWQLRQPLWWSADKHPAFIKAVFCIHKLWSRGRPYNIWSLTIPLTFGICFLFNGIRIPVGPENRMIPYCYSAGYNKQCKCYCL